MAANSSIEWTETTWNVVTGCTRVSPGCDHCYIERTPPFRMAHRKFDGDGPGSTTGVQMHPERMHLPLMKWRKPLRIFVNSLSDLFIDDVSDEYIAETFAVMALARQHTFQVLTKRPGRMRSLLTSEGFQQAVWDYWEALAVAYGEMAIFPTEGTLPLPNVWLGVTAENQKWANIRIPILLRTPAAVRFLSCEPLLREIDLRVHLMIKGDNEYHSRAGLGLPSIGWVIAGGESGPGARPMHPDWARSLRDQCVAAEVPFHFKQWGEYRPLAGNECAQVGDVWPDETQDAMCRRVGKKAAGRVLDGRTWDEYPAADLVPVGGSHHE